MRPRLRNPDRATPFSVAQPPLSSELSRHPTPETRPRPTANRAERMSHAVDLEEWRRHCDMSYAAFLVGCSPVRGVRPLRDFIPVPVQKPVQVLQPANCWPRPLDRGPSTTGRSSMVASGARYDRAAVECRADGRGALDGGVEELIAPQRAHDARRLNGRKTIFCALRRSASATRDSVGRSGTGRIARRAEGARSSGSLGPLPARRAGALLTLGGESPAGTLRH